MRVAVFSDSHGSVEPMRRAIREQEPELVLFLGDGWRDIETLRGEFPALPFRSVRGNCDIGGDAPDKLFFELEGVSIFMTHGHLYHVKQTLDSLVNAAGYSGARLALFGHTHQGEYTERRGVTLLNPGSAGTGRQPSFALLEVENGAFRCRILPISGGMK